MEMGSRRPDHVSSHQVAKIVGDCSSWTDRSEHLQISKQCFASLFFNLENGGVKSFVQWASSHYTQTQRHFIHLKPTTNFQKLKHRALPLTSRAIPFHRVTLTSTGHLEWLKHQFKL